VRTSPNVTKAAIFARMSPPLRAPVCFFPTRARDSVDRAMRIRDALIGAPLLLISFVALAQPKRAAKESEDKAAPSKSEKNDKAEPKGEPAAASGDDLGGPPPA